MNETKHTTKTHYKISNSFHGTYVFSPLSPEKFKEAELLIFTSSKQNRSALQRLLIEHYLEIRKTLCPNLDHKTACLCDNFNEWKEIS